MFLHNLLNVLVQIANKIGLQRKNTESRSEVDISNVCTDIPYLIVFTANVTFCAYFVGKQKKRKVL
jgi:hypothetical protein